MAVAHGRVIVNDQTENIAIFPQESQISGDSATAWPERTEFMLHAGKP